MTIKPIIRLGIALLSAHIVTANADDSAAGVVHSFEQLFGVSEGKRRNHTKGFCFNATLTPSDAEIKRYSHSPLFREVSTVIGRLSHKGGNNLAPDNKYADYGMGLSITTASNDVHLMSMNTQDFFPVATPEAFAELMRAKTQGKEKVKAFKQKNHDLQRFKAHSAKQAKTLKPYEGSRFNSINSFYLINAQGEKTAVRWSFIPSQPQAIVMQPTANFFYQNMQKNLTDHGVAWDMVITLANPDDKVNNAAMKWSGPHTHITAATLRVNAISTEANGECDTINYDPLVLSPGFEPSADPLLQARRNAYAISFGKRIVEKQHIEKQQKQQ